MVWARYGRTISKPFKVKVCIPLYDVKEGDILKTEIRIGRRTVPATFRED